MAHQLSVVVTCTDRKRLLPAPQRMARNLTESEVGARCGQWIKTLGPASEVDDALELEHLYQGDAWHQVLQLLAGASAAHRTRALVASAGLGLQNLDARHTSYAATFSQGHADTVAPAVEASRWWDGLKDTPHAQHIVDLRSQQALLVLSEPYARAMHDDLEALADTGADVLLVGGWKDIDGIHRLPADRALRSALGGTTGSLLIRMARRWLADWDGGPIYTESRKNDWDSWARDARYVERFNRKQLSDDEVLDFVSAKRDANPGISATRALKDLRDAGFACEQGRFGRLFRNAAQVA